MSDSKRWLNEHFRDHYVKKSKQEGYPSRAAYKLLEIQEKDHLMQPGMVIVDLGAAPGGWSMVAAKVVGQRGKVIAMDLLPMAAIPGVEFIQGDFMDDAAYNELLLKLSALSTERCVELVLSDMSPNLSGQKCIDQPRALGLVELAFHFAKEILMPGGAFLAKVFQGEGVDNLLKELRSSFNNVKIRKPKSSRLRSREFYIVAQDFKGSGS